METISPKNRPIGYWLTHLHRLIEDEFGRLLAAKGLRRRHWQCMNTLSKKPGDAADLAERLRPFWRPGEIELDEVLTDLKARGWLSESDSGALMLTPDGIADHAALTATTDSLRHRMMTGLTTAEYLSTVANLARMAENLAEPATRNSTTPALVDTVTVRRRVDNLDTAIPFYEKLTGQPANRFAFAGVQLAAIGPILLFSGPDEAAKQIAAITATVSTPDLPAAVATLRRWSAEVVADVSATPNGHRAIIKHPDGGVFEYVGA